MLEKLKVKFDRFMLNNYYHLPYKFSDRFDFPTKRLVKHCLEVNDFEAIKYKYELVAHMYAYDSTVSKEDLSLIHACYHTATRERVRQLLCKFVRKYYR